MRLLAIDTATSAGSAALLTEQGMFSEHFLRSRVTHSERLLSTVDALLEEAGWHISSIDAFAVCIGPGSFTGLRIGLAATKGLAWAGDKPLFGVSSLEAIAMGFPYARCRVCPVIDARKGQVFCALYLPGTGGAIEQIGEEVSVEPERLAASLNEQTLLAGNGLRLYRRVFEEAMGERALFAPESLWYSRASVVGLAALKRFENGERPSADAVNANYVRPSDAEIKFGTRGINENTE